MTDWKKLHGDHFRGARCLVTGGAGFIGSHIVEALSALGAQVVVIDNLIGGDLNNILSFRPQFIEGSILDRETINRAANGCNFVFHLAALGSVPHSVEKPLEYHDADATGTVQVLLAAKNAGVKRVMYSASYGLDTISLRYFNIFGPRQNPNSAYAAVIAAFAKAILAGKPPTIFGDGEQSRDFTFVHNAVHANLLAARHEKPLMGDVLNVACGKRVNLNQLAPMMCHLLGRDDLKPIYAPERPGDVKHSQADLTRIREVLGYRPIVDLAPGLDATLKWYATVLK